MTGLLIIVLSGMLTATFAVPLRFSREWAWENTWLVYATVAFVLMPFAFAASVLYHPFGFYRSLPLRDYIAPVLFGLGWGTAQVTFGIAITRVGMAMAFAIVIGLSALLGSSLPLVLFHPWELAGNAGAWLIASAALLIIGLTLYGRAGIERERASGKHSRRIAWTGLLLCVFTGCFGSMINIGFVSGHDIARRAIEEGVSPGEATLAVWAVVLAAGYFPNLIYTAYLLRRNDSGRLFKRSVFRELPLAIAAALLWLFGMLGYGMGASIMGKLGDSLGFAICMAVLLLWSSALGIMSGEWKGVSQGILVQMRAGLLLIIGSTSILGMSSLVRR